MRVVIDLHGITPLAMHNGRLADPLDPLSAEMAPIRKQRKRTDAEDRRLADLEWRGGLYYEPEMGVHIPAWNIVACLREAATAWTLGKATTQALAITAPRFRLEYDGPRKADALASRPEFTWRTTIGVNRKNRIPRVRPLFRQWSVTAEFELDEDVVSVANLERIAERAGRLIGLGDGRILGNGRFEATVRTA